MNYNIEVEALTHKMSEETGLNFSYENLGKVATKDDQFVVTIKAINNVVVGTFYIQPTDGKIAYLINDEHTLSYELEKWLIDQIGHATE